MWKRVARVLALVAVGAGALWWATFGSPGPEIRMSVAGGYDVPSFRLPVLDASLIEGDTTFVRSEELRGKVVLLAFWATWCSPCKAEQPGLLALQKEFADDGLVVLGVLHQDRPQRALDWLRENGRTEFKSLVGTPEYGRAARIGGLPNTQLIDRDGRVTEVFLGYWEEREEYMRDAVRALLEQE